MTMKLSEKEVITEVNSNNKELINAEISPQTAPYTPIFVLFLWMGTFPLVKRNTTFHNPHNNGPKQRKGNLWIANSSFWNAKKPMMNGAITAGKSNPAMNARNKFMI